MRRYLNEHEFYICYDNESYSCYYVHFGKYKYIGNEGRVEYETIEGLLSGLGIKFDVCLYLGIFRSDIRDIPDRIYKLCNFCRKQLPDNSRKQYCNDHCKYEQSVFKRHGKNNAKCLSCNTEFRISKKHRKHCSEKCRNAYNRKMFMLGKTDKDIGISMKLARVDYSKLESCSVDCLLQEFGDLE